MKKISIIGLGYIGLPTACFIASKGYSVNGVDIDRKKIHQLQSNEVPFYEPNLELFLQKSIKSQSLTFSVKPEDADIHIICVPTPFTSKSGKKIPDTSMVEGAFSSIINLLKKGDLIILESTSPIGTTEKLFNMLEKKNHELAQSVFMTYCPERVLPGNIFYELESNARIVGGINKESARVAQAFYQNFIKGDLLVTDSRTAEMAKLVENSFRDLNIAFANQLSMMSDEFQINPFELISLCNKHPRVNILQPGSGVGGHCIAVDPWFLAYKNKNSSLIKEARYVNEQKPNWIIKKVLKAIKKFSELNNREPVVSCLGLSFKPNIDDFRESPALKIAKKINRLHEKTFVVEPFLEEGMNQFKLISFSKSLIISDIVVCLVGHENFSSSKLKNFSKKRILLDFVGKAG